MNRESFSLNLSATALLGFACAAVLAGVVSGCNRSTPLASSGPGLVPTATMIPVIDDFEHPDYSRAIDDPRNKPAYVNYYGGSNLTDYGPKQVPVKTTTPSSINPYPNLEVVSGGSDLPGGTPGHCARIYGYSGWNDNKLYFPNAYPYAQAQLLFEHPVDADTVSSGHSISFSYKIPSGVASPNVFDKLSTRRYRFEMISSKSDEYAHYGYQFNVTLANANKWIRVRVYFPTYGTPALSQPSWATAVPWNTFKSSLTGVQFKAMNDDAAAGFNFDLYIDDISFD